MAVRNIVKIDEDKCNGCGQCVIDCAEGAIEIIDGKARLVSETYCDGLGACLGNCPMDAITIEQREAAAFDEEAVEQHLAESGKPQVGKPKAPAGCPSAGPAHGGGCPGSRLRTMTPRPSAGADATDAGDRPSQLGNWPVQLKLVMPTAPYFKDADVVVSADCVPFAMAGFHEKYLQGNPLVIACPKLDNPLGYVEKLKAILDEGGARSLTVLHMEVPCCTGLVTMARQAVEAAGDGKQLKEVTVSIDGNVLSETELVPATTP